MNYDLCPKPYPLYYKGRTINHPLVVNVGEEISYLTTNVCVNYTG
jgi:hypothetical protein